MTLYVDYKAGQIAGPNGLTFVVDTHRLKKKFVTKLFFLIPRATPGTSASSQYFIISNFV